MQCDTAGSDVVEDGWKRMEERRCQGKRDEKMMGAGEGVRKLWDGRAKGGTPAHRPADAGFVGSSYVAKKISAP